MINHVDIPRFINGPFTNCSVHVDSGEENEKFKAHKTSPLNTLYYDWNVFECWAMLEIKLADNFWRPDRKARRPHLNTRIWYVDVLIMTIEPSGPDNELLIRLTKQVKEKRGGHISKDDPLQINKQNM